MQLTTDQRPKFLRSFLDALGKEAEITGWRAVIPYALLPCVALAVAVAYFMPATFWSTHDQEMAVVVYSGILTFNGLILTLGWSAFSRIYDVLLRGDFGKYVMRAGLLADYLLQITYMHIFQVAAVIFFCRWSREYIARQHSHVDWSICFRDHHRAHDVRDKTGGQCGHGHERSRLAVSLFREQPAAIGAGKCCRDRRPLELFNLDGFAFDGRK